MIISFELKGFLHQVTDEEKRRREAEEMGDAMRSLENRTLDSKREMDIMAALDEMKSMKACICTRMTVFKHEHLCCQNLKAHLNAFCSLYSKCSRYKSLMNVILTNYHEHLC